MTRYGRFIYNCWAIVAIPVFCILVLLIIVGVSILLP